MSRGRRNKSSLIYKIMLYIKLDCISICAFVLIVFMITTIALSSQQTIDTSLSFNRQIMNQVDSIFNNMSEFSTQISLDMELEKMIKDYSSSQNGSDAQTLDSERIKLRLKTLATRNEYVIGLALATNDGQYFCSELNNNEKALFSSKWFKKYKSGIYSEYFSAPFTMQNKTLGLNKVVAICTPYKSVNGIQGDSITLMLFQPVQKIMNDVQTHSNDYVFLGNDNETVYPQGHGDYQKKLSAIIPKLNNIYQNDEFYSRYGLDYNFACISEVSRWKLITTKSLVSLFQPIWTYLMLIILSVLFYCLMTIFILLPTLNKLIRPLVYMSNYMRSQKAGEFKKMNYPKTGDEIETLGESYNYMIGELQNYFELTMSHEKEANRMKYSLLMSQIDPHFIYNTLNTVIYLARKQRCNDIIEVNKSLISILRDRLKVTDVEIFETVEHEIDVVNDYAVIQRYRFGDRFSLVWAVDESTRKNVIPKNIIQPLVENALFHGIFARTDTTEKGTVTIRIYRADDNLIIKVSDNGVGINELMLSSLNDWEKYSADDVPGRHIGIRNMQKRLNFLYEKSNCVKIESVLGKGTDVSVTLPYSEIAELPEGNPIKEPE